MKRFIDEYFEAIMTTIGIIIIAVLIISSVEMSSIRDSNFKRIDGSKCLYYSVDTKVIYIFGDYGNELEPFIGRNGKPCIYEDGKIKESEG